MSSKYNNIMFIGYLNTKSTETDVSNFCENYSLINLTRTKYALKTLINQLGMV